MHFQAIQVAIVLGNNSYPTQVVIDHGQRNARPRKQLSITISRHASQEWKSEGLIFKSFFVSKSNYRFVVFSVYKCLRMSTRIGRLPTKVSPIYVILFINRRRVPHLYRVCFVEKIFFTRMYVIYIHFFFISVHYRPTKLWPGAFYSRCTLLYYSCGGDHVIGINMAASEHSVATETKKKIILGSRHRQ